MARTTRRRAVAVGAAVGCLLLIGGIALAFWRTTGSGASAAGSTTVATLTLSPGTPSAQLYPGGSATVVLSAANPGAADVRISTLALATGEGDAGFDLDDDHTDCTVDSLALPTQSNGGAGWTVPASGSLVITLPAGLTMGTDAPDSCQGATFTVHLRVAS